MKQFSCILASLLSLAVFKLAAAETHTVQMVDFQFIPRDITVNVGDTIRWTRVSGSHDVQSDQTLFRSPAPPVIQFDFTFSQAGTWTYHCNPHASFGMRGSVKVQAAPPANVPPTVSITAPAEGATFSSPGPVPIQAQASDPDGTIARVEFFANGALVGSAIRSPYNATADNLAPGSYALTAKATDNQGASTTSATVHFTVTAAKTTVPPAVAIRIPANNSARPASATLTVEIDAADSDGSVASVALFRAVDHGGPAPGCCSLEPLGSTTTAPYRIPLSNLQPGFYHLVAEAADDQGAKSTSTEVVLTVYQPFRIETVTRTQTGTTLTVKDSLAPGAVTLSAQASDDIENWTTLPGTFAANGSGLLEFHDPTAAASRFYRVQAQFHEVAPADRATVAGP